MVIFIYRKRQQLIEILKIKRINVAIADHIYNDSGFQNIQAGKNNDTLKEAYEAYS